MKYSATANPGGQNTFSALFLWYLVHKDLVSKRKISHCQDACRTQMLHRTSRENSAIWRH